jgi:hypothetical protein
MAAPGVGAADAPAHVCIHNTIHTGHGVSVSKQQHSGGENITVAML